jgi:hypothetical protein
MRRHLSVVAAFTVLAAAVSVSAQTASPNAGKASNGNSMDLKPAEPIGGRVTEKSETTSTSSTSESCGKECAEAGKYLEVSDFFNIREANPSVNKGEWELEQSASWETLSDHTDDDVYLWTSLKYGVTEDLFVELEVAPLNIGDGGDQGNGDLNLIVFNRFVKETDALPSLAGWAEMRIPSGDGSSGVDGIFHATATKTLTCNLRAHMDGYVETANGGRGDQDINRRHFQWGVGPGFDYSFSEKTIGVLNYLMRSSDEYGHHNSNILELGMVRQLAKGLHLKPAIDIGLDGQEETPNFATKLEISYDFGGSSCD